VAAPTLPVAPSTKTVFFSDSKGREDWNSNEVIDSDAVSFQVVFTAACVARGTDTTDNDDANAPSAARLASLGFVRVVPSVTFEASDFSSDSLLPPRVALHTCHSFEPRAVATALSLAREAVHREARRNWTRAGQGLREVTCMSGGARSSVVCGDEDALIISLFS
jgi:hypothetical protein